MWLLILGRFKLDSQQSNETEVEYIESFNNSRVNIENNLISILILLSMLLIELYIYLNDTIPSHLKTFQYLHHPLRNT